MINETSPAVLITDDEPGLRLALRVHFGQRGWYAETASGLTEAKASLARRSFDLVLCDVRMNDGSGFEVMQAVQKAAPNTAMLFLTAYGSVPEAVRAMQNGAVDYLTKPISFDQLFRVASRIVRQRRPLDPGHNLTDSDILGRSRSLQLSLARAKAAAEGDANVLIEGEGGTGKELLADFIHRSSRRRDRKFIKVNCARIGERVIETELFGDSLADWTGRNAAVNGKLVQANGGTLLLKEVGDLSLSVQSKLLGVIQRRCIAAPVTITPPSLNVRLIATSTQQLRVKVNAGLFRSELFYLLNAVPLTLPPLRERAEDVPLLAEHFAETAAKSVGRPDICLHPNFLRHLQTYQWPGNVRELQKLMERVVSVSQTPEITTAVFDREDLSQPCVPAQESEAFTRAQAISLDQLERSHLERTLELVDGNRTRAAEILGISVRTVRNKIRQYQLPPRRYA